MEMKPNITVREDDRDDSPYKLARYLCAMSLDMYN